MICRRCHKYFSESDMKGKEKLYCERCLAINKQFIISRKYKLSLLQALPLDLKILKSKMLFAEAVALYGIDQIYLSYSGGKDSTVLSHLIRQTYPNILHIFANTTCEYPETLQHIMWQKKENNMNIITVTPHDKMRRPWNFKRVVSDHGFPMFSKVVANAIRTYRRAQTPTTKKNSLEYMERRFKKYICYKDLNISDKCCEKLKKNPLKQMAHKLKLECAVIGTLAVESHQRESDWINYGCNVFGVRKDNQCRPLSFWTEDDIYEYLNKFNVKISTLYQMGYSRNGCMFCGFGIEHDILDGKNRFERMADTHPKMYQYFINNFKTILEQCGIRY